MRLLPGLSSPLFTELPRRILLGNLHSYTRVRIRCRGVWWRHVCSPGFREEFFSETGVLLCACSLLSLKQAVLSELLSLRNIFLRKREEFFSKGGEVQAHYAPVASIRYGDITNIETNPAASNSAIKINALDYRLNESHNEIYQGNHVAPARDFMLSAALTTIPITRWALAKAKPYLYIIADFIGEAKEE